MRCPLRLPGRISCWAEGNEDDPLTLFRTRYAENPVLNWTNFTSPEIDAQLEILGGVDPAARKAAAAEISRITAEQMTVNWWASGSTLVLTVPELKGLETYTYPDDQVGERRGSGRLWWHEVWLEGAEPADDLPSGFIPTPEPPVTTTTTVPEEPEEPEEPEAGGQRDDVLAAMPAPPGGLAVGGNDPPLADLCPGITTLEGIEPISASSQGYDGDPALGPFGAITVYELAPGDADIIVGRYDQAVSECASYTTELDGNGLDLGYATRDLGSYGDASAGYGNAGTITTADGTFPIDSDIILIRSGDNLALVTALHVLSPADGSISVPLAEGAVVALAVLG